jgi:heme/copper-type cytochrome/quinol oxidase subunit 2
LFSKQGDLRLFFFGSFFSGFSLFFSGSGFSYLIDWFHNFNYSLLLGVLFFVVFLFFFLLFSFFFFKRVKIEYQWGELFCRIFPRLILFGQMLPSLGLLYFYGIMSLERQLSLKVVGHQWY